MTTDDGPRSQTKTIAAFTPHASRAAREELWKLGVAEAAERVERSARASCGREKGHTDRAGSQADADAAGVVAAAVESALKTATQRRPNVGDEPAAVIDTAEQQPAGNQQREDRIGGVAQRRNHGGVERVQQHQWVPQL